MGDSSPSAAAISSNGTRTSTFRRTVTLYDWWLTKSQSDFHGYRLAVSGISSRKEEAVRFFVSAPIIKRYDVFSLGTADSIYVITRGFINEQRTLENGFTSQISKSFLYGFPPNWESYALECIGKGSEANIDLDNVVPDNVSVICQEILSDGEENFIPTSLVLPDEALEKCKKPFATEECKASKEMSGVDVAYGSGGNRHSTRLRNIKVCQQKQRYASGGPCEHPYKEQSSTSTEVETRDSDTAVSDNVSPNIPEMSSDAAEKFFPTLVSHIRPREIAIRHSLKMNGICQLRRVRSLLFMAVVGIDVVPGCVILNSAIRSNMLLEVLQRVKIKTRFLPQQPWKRVMEDWKVNRHPFSHKREL